MFKAPNGLILELYDFEHSIEEDRIISIGPILRGTIVVVSVERDDGNTISIISARFATKKEQTLYSEEIARISHE